MKNMFVKLDHLHRDRGENKQILEITTRKSFGVVCVCVGLLNFMLRFEYLDLPVWVPNGSV